MSRSIRIFYELFWPIKIFASIKYLFLSFMQNLFYYLWLNIIWYTTYKITTERKRGVISFYTVFCSLSPKNINNWLVITYCWPIKLKITSPKQSTKCVLFISKTLTMLRDLNRRIFTCLLIFLGSLEMKYMNTIVRN